MRLFDTNVQELKYKVLREVIRLDAEGTLNEKRGGIPRTIVPGPKATMRCCIYHERAIVEERVRLAMGEGDETAGTVEVIGPACEECPNQRFSVTGTCRGCIAHRCAANCPAAAISFVEQKAVIDPEKCRECGRCMRVCPYSAIIEQQRPCIRGCKAKAISLDGQRKAKIDESKCIACGTCVYQCPFGAIVDRSFVLRAAALLRGSQGGKAYRVVAALAPAVATQFSYAKIGQIVAGLKQIGFDTVAEVAEGAGHVAHSEARELAEKGFLTTSCCPAFVEYTRKNFPKLAGHISSNTSPMVETARLIKAADPSAKVVFIGPCIAKKREFLQEGSGVDCVLTFEELQAFFDGRGVRIEELPEEPLSGADYFGRVFARSGGVTDAVAHALAEENSGFELRPEVCNGLEACRAALLKASAGKLAANFIEGMACEGGCIGGAACLSHGPADQREVEKYARRAGGGAPQSTAG